jgi:hypothetical protein
MQRTLEIDKRRHSTATGRGSRRGFRFKEVGVRQSTGRGIDKESGRRRHIDYRYIRGPTRHYRPTILRSYNLIDRSSNRHTDTYRL